MELTLLAAFFHSNIQSRLGVTDFYVPGDFSEERPAVKWRPDVNDFFASGVVFLVPLQMACKCGCDRPMASLSSPTSLTSNQMGYLSFSYGGNQSLGFTLCQHKSHAHTGTSTPLKEPINHCLTGYVLKLIETPAQVISTQTSKYSGSSRRASLRGP